MNFLDLLAANLGVNIDGLDTDEKKMAAIVAGSTQCKASVGFASTVMQKLGAKTHEEALSTLATMVPRETFAKTENALADADLKLVLLEGQMSGKLSKADCEGEGWAAVAAKTSPATLRAMLPTLPPKVATGAAVASMVAGLQTKTHDDGTAPTKFVHNGKTYGLTDLTKSYGEKDMANLHDLFERYGEQAMITQGYVKAE